MKKQSINDTALRPIKKKITLPPLAEGLRFAVIEDDWNGVGDKPYFVASVEEIGWNTDPSGETGLIKVWSENMGEFFFVDHTFATAEAAYASFTQ